MKKMNKKGFTIVELTIVIAVIAILAAVLIPTFSGIVTKANQSAAQQEALSLYKEVYAIDLSDGVLDGNDNNANDKKISVKGFVAATSESVTTAKNYYYSVKNNAVEKFVYCNGDYIATYNGTSWTVTLKAS